MRQEIAMGMFALPKKAFCRLIFLITNSVKMLNHILFPSLNDIFVGNLVSFNRKVYFEIDRSNS